MSVSGSIESSLAHSQHEIILVNGQLIAFNHILGQYLHTACYAVSTANNLPLLSCGSRQRFDYKLCSYLGSKRFRFLTKTDEKPLLWRKYTFLMKFKKITRFKLLNGHFLQCGHIGCNAECCINHSNSVCPSIHHTLVLYPDE